MLWVLQKLIDLVSVIGGGNRVPGENQCPVASHWQTLLHNVVLSKPRPSWVVWNVVGFAETYWFFFKQKYDIGW
jgi:hypothetical protein